ncbi:MAG: ABC transporter ATP-binding protein [Clostridiaceae bacterium]|nr:ABC transporter ATP-binding protein [Clostridiaceae bacterium]
MPKVILNTKDLCKTYLTDGEAVHAIKNINLDIYQGDFTVIMGSSGSGKSTLLYILSGMEDTTSGSVNFEEIVLNDLNEDQLSIFRRKKIGFVFQGINLVPNLSIIENVILPGYLVEKSKKKVDQRARELLGIFGLEEQSFRLPSQVSGGQQQRGAIARALINSPQVLFADEPTGALNSLQGQNILNVFTELNSKGQTLVMVTHDIKAACRADRILFIKDGRIDGDMKLCKYSETDISKREKTIFDYLTQKGW